MDKAKITNLISNNKKTIFIVAISAVVLTASILLVRAGTPFVALESEGGLLAGNTSIKSAQDASGGSFIEFGSATSGGNAAFTINIKTPQPQTRYASGSTIAVGAELTGSDGNGVRVEFYKNGELFDTRPRIPYLGVLKTPADGDYQLVAVAIDSQGKKAVSSPVNVKVKTGFDDCSGVDVAAGGNIQNAINAAGSGGTVCFGPGMHRLTAAVTVPNGINLVGRPGAIISGGKLITNWQFDSGRQLWKATGQTQQSQPLAKFGCIAGYPRCGYNEDLFMNDVRLLHVDTLSKVTSGTFFFDYAADTIWMKDDPRGKSMENAVLDKFISNRPSNVTIKGLKIERFASPFQEAPVDLNSGSNILANEFAHSHARGFKFSSNSKAVGNYAHNNGMQGYGCGGNNLLDESNTLVRNGGNHFDGGALGGTKCSYTDSYTARGTVASNNVGNGLWTDIDNIRTLYEYNLLEDNTKSGIFHEISWSAEIRYNIARRNGINHSFNKAHGDFWLSNSEDVVIHHNESEGNHVSLAMAQVDRGGIAEGHKIQDIYIHSNTVFIDMGHAGINIASPFNSDIDGWLSQANIKYDKNTYYMRGGVGKTYFYWKNKYMNKDQWQSFGNDVNGRFFDWQ